ncbi:MAG: RluA family pseudouridine synthase [Lachnospiraceae bacterium]|nr:RluA family pseudouridine synthase [Lachnospiraceae bacterium]
MKEEKEEIYFEVTEEMEEERIDKLLPGIIDSLSRSYIQQLIKEGRLWVNQKPVKANYRVKAGEKIRLELPPAIEPDIQPENIPLEILYEDEDVLVVNKPKGMVVHPAAGHYSGTLVNAVMYHCKEKLSGINGILRPGIVHRIDRDTTGSILICKNDISHNHLAAQLKEHTVVRKYHALCYGRIAEEEGVVDAPIGRHPTDRKKMAINSSHGKRAVTHYKVLTRFRDYTYIECQLETGRTHQIRVHLSSIGHPLLGDEVYAGNRKSPYQLQGQCLHAKILGFIHPVSGVYIETDAPLPEYFKHLLSILY